VATSVSGAVGLALTRVPRVSGASIDARSPTGG